LLFISISIQSGNFWIHPRISRKVNPAINTARIWFGVLDVYPFASS